MRHCSTPGHDLSLCKCAAAPGMRTASRRGMMLAGLAAGAALAAPRHAAAQSKLTPAQALAALMEGNKRFAANKITACSSNLANLRESTAQQQQPFAAVLSCADSRVPVEWVFDQSIGQIFVARVAGNIANADIIASLEYGAAVLGTRTIMVLGHGGCGAVKAAMSGKPVPGQISTLFRTLRPAIDAAQGDVTAAIKANAKIQARLLRDSSPVLGDMVAGGKLSITAGYYDLARGTVSLLG